MKTLTIDKFLHNYIQTHNSKDEILVEDLSNERDMLLNLGIYVEFTRSSLSALIDRCDEHLRLKYGKLQFDDALIDYIKDIHPVGHVNGYEVHHVKTYRDARRIGAFYQGIEACWNISARTDYYWNSIYRNDTIYILVREIPKGDEFDKVAFQFKENDLQIWDLKNRSKTFKDEEVISYMKRYFHWIDLEG